VPALYDAAVLAHWPYPVTPDATLAELQKLAGELFFAHLTAEDLLRNDIRDSMAHDNFGIALDLSIRCADWGFTLADVRAPVIMEHSKADAEIPFVTASLTAGLLPSCRLLTRERGDHFSQ
jgi:hypothetical protein